LSEVEEQGHFETRRALNPSLESLLDCEQKEELNRSLKDLTLFFRKLLIGARLTFDFRVLEFFEQKVRIFFQIRIDGSAISQSSTGNLFLDQASFFSSLPESIQKRLWALGAETAVSFSEDLNQGLFVLVLDFDLRCELSPSQRSSFLKSSEARLMVDVFDQKVLESLKKYKLRGQSMFRVLAEDYLLRSEDILKKIQKCQEQNLSGELKLQSHTLKSLSLTLGLKKVGHLCQQIESESKNPEVAREALLQLVLSLPQARSALEQVLEMGETSISLF
jgi:HPt (histidine-containing phosphotransfer) domain-containing protein